MSVDAVLTETSDGFDFNIDANGDIETDNFFDTAIQMSLFCERRATDSEVGPSHKRRGWIGNEQGNGFEIGSKLWLFEQERVTRSLLSSIEKAALNGLQWLIDDGYATNIESDAQLSTGRVTLNVTIERPNSKVEHRFFELWEKSGVR